MDPYCNQRHNGQVLLPMNGSASKTRGLNPRLANSNAQVNPASAAPMMSHCVLVSGILSMAGVNRVACYTY